VVVAGDALHMVSRGKDRKPKARDPAAPTPFRSWSSSRGR
jgi:hypothetical protein